VRARRKEWKGLREGLKHSSYSAREGEGTPVGEAAAINGHGGRRPSLHSRERLEWRGNRRS
jgi:hypothetical protein